MNSRNIVLLLRVVVVAFFLCFAPRKAHANMAQRPTPGDAYAVGASYTLLALGEGPFRWICNPIFGHFGGCHEVGHTAEKGLLKHCTNGTHHSCLGGNEWCVMQEAISSDCGTRIEDNNDGHHLMKIRASEDP